MRRSAEKMRDGYYPKQWTSLPMPSEQIGRGSLLNRPSYPPEGPISRGTKLNWTEPISTICITRIDDSLLFNVSRKPTHTNQNLKFVCYQQVEPSAHPRMQPAPSAPMRTKPRQEGWKNWWRCLMSLGTQVATGHSKEQTSLPTPAMSESSTMVAIPMNPEIGPYSCNRSMKFNINVNWL